MSGCCSLKTSDSSSDLQDTPKKLCCPANGSIYKTVPFKTVLHHLKKPWRSKAKDQAYYFCDDTNCDVVYFGEDQSIINHNELKTRVGNKQASDDSMICYCFNVTRQDALADKNIRQFVVNATKNKQCNCEISNPSGKCCLKDFPNNT